METRVTMNRRTRIFLAALCWLLLPAAAPAADKPVIAGPVLNGASFEGSVPSEFGPSPIDTGLAGGSIFVIFGSRLGPLEIVLGTAPYPDQLPAEAGGTRSHFDRLWT